VRQEKAAGTHVSLLAIEASFKKRNALWSRYVAPHVGGGLPWSEGWRRLSSTWWLWKKLDEEASAEPLSDVEPPETIDPECGCA
jgi:hypothetical protein